MLADILIPRVIENDSWDSLLEYFKPLTQLRYSKSLQGEDALASSSFGTTRIKSDIFRMLVQLPPTGSARHTALVLSCKNEARRCVPPLHLATHQSFNETNRIF